MNDEPILKGLANNEALFEAVKKRLLSKFSFDGDGNVTTGLHGFDNEGIGEIVRAMLDGRARVEEAFSEILRLKTSKENKPAFNPAR